MQCIRYRHDHLPGIAKLFIAREMSELIVLELPQIGYVAEDNGEIIAAGFLRQAEGNYAIIDGIISSPKASPIERDDALNLVLSKLIKHSEQLRIKVLIGWTSDESTRARAERHGFKRQPDTFLIRPGRKD